MAATASGRCECRREAAVERATAGREAAGATATRAGACATAVKVQRARARAFLLMYYRRAQVAGVVCGVRAICVCVCVCAGMEAARRAPTWPRAGCSLARFDACAYHKYNFELLRPTRLIQSRRSPSTAWKHNDHPRGTRRQELKLHADNSTIFTSYCSHEQH